MSFRPSRRKPAQGGPSPRKVRDGILRRLRRKLFRRGRWLAKLDPVMMHAVHFLAFWGAAFLTLCAALGLLSVFYQLVGSDLELESLGKEALVAAFASLFEGVGLWVALSVLHGGGRILLVPGLIVFIIYRLHHLTDWSGYEPGVILVFQLVIGYCAAMLFAGQFGTALVIALVFVASLGLVASLVKSLF
jgi:hypothetical protein